MNFAVQLCELPQDEIIEKLHPNRYLNDSWYQTLEYLKPDFEETIVQCKIFNKLENCTDVMVPILSEKGFCYSFNTFRLQDVINEGLVYELGLVCFRFRFSSNF